MKKLSKVLLLALFVNSSALAAEFGVLGGLSTFSPTAKVSLPIPITVQSYSSVMGGVYFKENLSMLFGVELDAIYLKKKVRYALAGFLDSTDESKAIQVPLILRANLIPGGYFNFGVGAYYEAGMSSGVDSTNNLTGASGNQTYANAGVKHNDYGAVGSVQLKIPLAPTVKFSVEGRYLYGLAEQSADTSAASGGLTIKNRYMQVIAGLGFGM